MVAAFQVLYLALNGQWCVQQACMPCSLTLPAESQALAFSPDGVWLLSLAAAPEGAIAIWDVATGEVVAAGAMDSPAVAADWRRGVLPEFVTAGHVRCLCNHRMVFACHRSTSDHLAHDLKASVGHQGPLPQRIPAESRQGNLTGACCCRLG